MALRLPPLNALKALEAAGRHVSFTRAAEELHVTPGAISRQIKLLEDILGVELFERTNRDLRITDETKLYAATLTEVFDRIDAATQRLLNARRERPLHVHCPMTFTLKWLVTRLPAFHALYPKREIRLTTSLAPLPTHLLSTGDVDVVIQQGTGSWPDLTAHKLAGSELIPVCSPKLLSAGPPLKKVGDLAQHTLLHSLVRPNDWTDWCAAAGAPEVDAQRGLRFESSSLAYQAAHEGLGVAIGQMALVIEDIESGRLIAPFDFVHDNNTAYYLTYLENAPENSRLTEFRNWILAEAERYNRSHRFPPKKERKRA